MGLLIGQPRAAQVTFGLRLLDLGTAGYIVVALFFATWAGSLVYWKARRVDERWTA